MGKTDEVIEAKEVPKKTEYTDKSYTVLYPLEGLKTLSIHKGADLEKGDYNIAFLLRTGHLEEKV